MGPKNTSACVSLRLALAIHRDICKDETCELRVDWQDYVTRMAEVLDIYEEPGNRASKALVETRALLSRLAAAHGEKAKDEQGRD